MRYFWLFVYLMASVVPEGMAQESFLWDFRAYQSGSEVQLVWTIRGGNTCFGTIIERAEDGETFAEIGEISGICGSNEGDETYTFTDSTPAKNSFNYYRLQFGGVGTSDTQTVEFLVLKEAGFVIINNPLLTASFIQFPNPTQALHRLRVSDLSGKLHLTKETETRRIKISRGELQGGLYILELSSPGINGQSYFGKLLVK